MRHLFLVTACVLGLSAFNVSMAYCDFGDTNCQRHEDEMRYQRQQSQMDSLRNSGNFDMNSTQEELRRSQDRLRSY